MERARETTLTAGGIALDTSPERFGFLLDSSDAVDRPALLRSRMDRDGYVFLPGFFEREAVRQVRTAVCALLASEGILDPTAPLEAAVARQGAKLAFRPDIANNSAATPPLESLIYGHRTMRLMSDLLGEPAMHYDYTWMRTIAPGHGTYPHCDIVYMGRGSHRVYTAWTPLGDVPLHVGGLILLESSHQDRELRGGYCTLDVDTACRNDGDRSQLNAAGFPGFGALSLDMPDVQRRLGRRLLTAQEYRMGDLLLFSVFTVHGSLDNSSREIRISSDSRYQPASEPADERWVGEDPPAHGGSMVKGMIC